MSKLTAYPIKEEVIGEKETNFRMVIHREPDNASFIEIDQTDYREKRNKFNYALLNLSDEDLYGLRDFLNEALK